MPDRPSLFDSPDLTYRMSMLPGATYRNPDGSERLEWALPSMITEPIDALYRLGQNSVLPDGRPGIPNPQNVENQNDVLTGLLSLYGGNAMNPGRLLEGASARAVETAAPHAAYRGAPTAERLFQTDKPFFMSSSPEVAGTYAGMFPNGPGVLMDDLTQQAAGSVAPMQPNFKNPMVVDAQGRAWNDIPFNGNWIDSNALTYLARDAGHDGLVIKNVTDHLGAPGSVAPADTYVALKRGTVTSPLTGETLFSDTGKPSLFGAAIAGAEGNTPLRAYRGFGGRDVSEPLIHPDADKFYASSAPETAGTYANARQDGSPVLGSLGISTSGAVAPIEMKFSNPMTVDAQGNIWDRIPFQDKTWASTDDIARHAQDLGHDGLVIRNVRDNLGKYQTEAPADTYVALRRGTVRSPLTGETLFSDQFPSLFGSALSPYQQEPRNALLDY